MFTVSQLHVETICFVFVKISYLQPFREIMGGQTKHQFLAKNDATGQKNDLFRIFLCCCTSTHQGATFCFYKNFISSAVQRNHGGTRKKRYIERRRTTTNDERRTNYMDDHKTPSGFFQNPRANKYQQISAALAKALGAVKFFIKILIY